MGVLAAVAAVAGCGVSTQPDPDVIAQPLAGASGEARADEPPGEATVQRAVYLTEGDRLTRVFRQVPYAAGVDGSLAALEVAPSPDESAAGLRSALPAGAGHLLSRVAGGTAVVSVPSAYESLGLEQQVMAVAQIVFTVTAVAGVSAVEFSVGGQIVDVPVANGQLQSGPLTRADYAPLAPAAHPTASAR
jgi:hypothetical protein